VTDFDVIFPLNFGAPANLPANLAIAATALRESRRLKLPIFFAPAEIFDFGDYSHQFSTDFTGYISTVKQVRALAEAAAVRGWRRVLIVAAPPHLWRALRDVRAQGLSAGADNSIRAYPKNLWYSKNSTHRQTTAWWRWWFTWELPARAVILACRGYYERRALR
jgi:hypothetical protein